MIGGDQVEWPMALLRRDDDAARETRTEQARRGGGHA
jgi:hypothetical protein